MKILTLDEYLESTEHFSDFLERNLAEYGLKLDRGMITRDYTEWKRPKVKKNYLFFIREVDAKYKIKEIKQYGYIRYHNDKIIIKIDEMLLYIITKLCNKYESISKRPDKREITIVIDSTVYKIFNEKMWDAQSITEY